MHDARLPAHGRFTNFVKLLRQGMQPFGIEAQAIQRRHMVPAKIAERHGRPLRGGICALGERKDQEAAKLPPWGECGGAGDALSPGDPDGGHGLGHIILPCGGDGQIHHGGKDTARMLYEVLKALQRAGRRVRPVAD